MYKSQGRIQRFIMISTYKTFLVHEEEFQASIPTTLAVRTNGRPFRAGDDVQPTV